MLTPILQVKPNVGHSEAASSMGTLIKTILALESGFMAPTAGINRPNPASTFYLNIFESHVYGISWICMRGLVQFKVLNY